MMSVKPTSVAAGVPKNLFVEGKKVSHDGKAEVESVNASPSASVKVPVSNVVGDTVGTVNANEVPTNAD